MNFAPVAWIDTFDLAGSLRQRGGMFEGEDGLLILPIRSRRGEGYVAARATEKWPELKVVLNRIQRIGEAQGGIEFGEIWMQMLGPGEIAGWSTRGGLRYALAHLPLRTNPACMTYSGVESAHLHIGALTIVNQALPCSALNLGETPKVDLLIEFRRKADA